MSVDFWFHFAVWDSKSVNVNLTTLSIDYFGTEKFILTFCYKHHPVSRPRGK
jgi:hypothetical protein